MINRNEVVSVSQREFHFVVKRYGGKILSVQRGDDKVSLNSTVLVTECKYAHKGAFGKVVEIKFNDKSPPTDEIILIRFNNTDIEEWLEFDALSFSQQPVPAV